jgi:nucleoside phosphorylase
MEMSGVCAAAQEQTYSVPAIRGISDIVGFKRDDKWTPYAAEAAGAFRCGAP